jgi:hypothetical protein
MSLIVNASPYTESDSIDNKKKIKNQTIKKQNRPKLPSINFTEDENDLADFRPLEPPKIMKEPNMTKSLEDEYITEGFSNEGFNGGEKMMNRVSEYPNKYDEKPMSKMQQHLQLTNSINSASHPINSSNMNVPLSGIHEHTLTHEQKELNEKIDYMIKLLEDQKHEKTEGVMEDVILYSFLGIFMIFLVESFTKKSTKYVR